MYMSKWFDISVEVYQVCEMLSWLIVFKGGAVLENEMV